MTDRILRSFTAGRGRGRAASLALLAALVVAAPLRAQQPLPSDSSVRALLEARAALAPSSGAVIGLIDVNGRRVLAVGSVNGSGTPAPTARTLFEIGSLTKAFTGTLLADAVLRDRVALDTPVAALLPDSVRVPSRGDRKITLLDLATHSSGLPRLPTNMAPVDPRNPYADYDAARLYAFLSSYTLPREPGAKYEYSNLGTGLLGFALARAADTSYAQLVRERITEPLGMEDTRIALGAEQRARLAPGHDVGGDTTANWDLAVLAGAGALRSTVGDLLDFLAAAMHPDTTTAVGRALRLAEQPRRPAGSPVMRIGLGWHVRIAHGDTIVWHNGATAGYHSFLGFDPARGVGLVVLSNSAVPYDDVALHLLDPSVPITPPDVPQQRTAITLTATQLEPYVGRYRMSPTAVLTVTRDGTQLYAQLTGQERLPVYAERDGRFFLRVVDAVLDFERDAQGAVTAVVLHQNGQTVRGSRLP